MEENKKSSSNLRTTKKLCFNDKSVLTILQLYCMLIPFLAFSQSNNTYGTGYLGGETYGNEGDKNVNIGLFAGESSLFRARFNVSVGYFSGRDNGEDNNVFIGSFSGNKNYDGNDNTFLGAFSGRYNLSGERNVYIGSRSGFNNISGSGNIFIGKDSGRDETGSNKLYIANTSTTTPLIWGDFVENKLRVNGDLDVTGKFTINGNEINTGGVNSLWTSLSNQNIVHTEGKVGIGTTNPNYKLDVNGEVHTEGNLILSGGNNYGIFSNPTNGRGNIIIPGPSSQYSIGVQDGNGRVQHKWNATTGTNETFIVGGENAFFMNYKGGVGSNNRWLEYRFADGTGKSAGTTIDWQTHFSIEKNGNVGIGMTSAATEKLEVNGNIKASGGLYATRIETTNDSKFKGDVYLDKIIQVDEAVYSPIGYFSEYVETKDVNANYGKFIDAVTTKEIVADVGVINNTLNVKDLTVSATLNTNQIEIESLNANTGEISSALTVGSLISSNDITTSTNLNCEGLTIKNKPLKNYIVDLIEEEVDDSNNGGGILGGAIAGALSGTITGAASGAIVSYIGNKAKFAGDVLDALGDAADTATDVADNLQKKAKNNKAVTPWKKSVRIGESQDGFTGIKYTRGYVMIGNSNDDDKERLLVNGRTNINGNLVAKRIAIFNNPGDFNRGDNPAWPDYVFEKNYDLKPLQEVESFIDANKHLPEVPSAKEVSEKGIDVYNMNATLLKKVEELTLYTIDQEKEIKAQKELLKKQEDRLKKLENILLNKTK